MKVGYYVRTKHFGINKIKGFYSDVHYDYIMVDDDLIKKEDIIKSSPNIIDLIEEGDYVNDDRVIDIEKYPDGTIELNFYISQGGYYQIYDDKDIKSIVTKEQFENCMYIVGE